LTDQGKGPSTNTAVPPRRGGKGGTSKPSGGSSRPAKRPAGRRAAQEAQDRRRRNMYIAAGAVGVVVAILVVLVVVGTNTSKAASPRTPLTPAESEHIQSVPLPTLVAATKLGVTLQPPSALSQPLTSGAKPEVLYIGAEFCPICATQRWPLTVALSQFGKFTNLSSTSSSVQDGNIPTLSYYGSSYSSPYLVFTPVETTTNEPQGNYYKTLETPTPEQKALWSKDLGGHLSFPYINMGGKYLLSTSQFPSTVLQGPSFSEIMGDVGNNSSDIGKNIDASAGALVKYLCNVTGDQPSNVCQAVASVPAPVGTSSGSSSAAG